MGRLIVSAQMTLDGVIDHIDEWFDGAGAHEVAGREQLFEAGALLLGRETYQGLSRVWPTMSDDSGFAERVNHRACFLMRTYVRDRRRADPARRPRLVLRVGRAAGRATAARPSGDRRRRGGAGGEL